MQFEKKLKQLHNMNRTDTNYQLYINILKEELIPAMGCTEPICLAYAAAKARQILGEIPDRVEVLASGNIIKNVKSVIVPNTNGMKGIKAAAAVGIIAGDPDKELQVIANVTAEQKAETERFLATTPITVKHVNCNDIVGPVLLLKQAVCIAGSVLGF